MPVTVRTLTNEGVNTSVRTEDQAPESTQDDFKRKNKGCNVQDRVEKSD